MSLEYCADNPKFIFDGTHKYQDECSATTLYSKNIIVTLRLLPMLQEALYTPHWSINSHGIVYVTRGEAQVQIVDHSGQNIMNDRVKQGNMFVVPQYYAASVKA